MRRGRGEGRRETERDMHREIKTDTKERQTERQNERQCERERESDRQTDTDGQTEGLLGCRVAPSNAKSWLRHWFQPMCRSLWLVLFRPIVSFLNVWRYLPVTSA